MENGAKPASKTLQGPLFLLAFRQLLSRDPGTRKWKETKFEQPGASRGRRLRLTSCSRTRKHINTSFKLKGRVWGKARTDKENGAHSSSTCHRIILFILQSVPTQKSSGGHYWFPGNMQANIRGRTFKPTVKLNVRPSASHLAHWYHAGENKLGVKYILFMMGQWALFSQGNNLHINPVCALLCVSSSALLRV